MIRIVATSFIAWSVFLLTPAAAVVIDDFETAQSLTLGVGSTFYDFVSGAGILGGERDLAATRGGLGSDDVSVEIDEGDSGILDFSVGTDTNGAMALVWDGVDGDEGGDFEGLGGVDLTAGGSHHAIGIEVLSSDQPIDIMLGVSSDASNASGAEISVPGGVVSSQWFVVPFTSFSATTGGGADFSNVGAIVLGIIPTSSINLQIELIETLFVPEPGSFVLAGCGVIGLLLAARRSRRRARGDENQNEAC